MGPVSRFAPEIMSTIIGMVKALNIGSKRAVTSLKRPLRRLAGDMAVLGKGEIFIANMNSQGSNVICMKLSCEQSI
jgi:hypothetical protein